MSMMRCERCQRVVDTDEDLDGIWSDFGYTCEACTEAAEDGTADDPRPVSP